MPTIVVRGRVDRRTKMWCWPTSTRTDGGSYREHDQLLDQIDSNIRGDRARAAWLAGVNGNELRLATGRGADSWPKGIARRRCGDGANATGRYPLATAGDRSSSARTATIGTAAARDLDRRNLRSSDGTRNGAIARDVGLRCRPLSNCAAGCFGHHREPAGTRLCQCHPQELTFRTGRAMT